MIDYTMRNTNKEIDTSIQILLQWCEDKGFCPSKKMKTIYPSVLYSLALRNKFQDRLMHLVECHSCTKELDGYIKNKIHLLQIERFARMACFESEKKILLQILQKTDSYGVLFKQHPNCSATNNSGDTFKADLDVLVANACTPKIISQYRSLGYKKKNKGARKEVQLIHPKTCFEIDLHHLLAYPHYGSISDAELSVMRGLSSRHFIVTPKSTKQRLRVSSAENHLLDLTVRYWWNDMCLGLRSLHDIHSFYTRYVDDINWIEFFSITDSYKITPQVTLIFAISKNIFGGSLPHAVWNRTSWGVCILSYIFTLHNISVFPSVVHWYNKKYYEFVQNHYSRIMILKLCLDKQTPLLRLIRPRILLLWTHAFWRFCLHRMNLSTDRP